MGYGHMRRGAVVALVLVTVIGMTAAPVLANSTHATDDCDLVDIDGDNNDVVVNIHQEHSEFTINCGDDGDDEDGGDAGVNDAADAGGDADAGTQEVNVNVNGEDVDVSEDQDPEVQQPEQQEPEVQQQEVQQQEVQQPEQQDAEQQNVENDAGDQNVEDDAGDQNVEQGEGDQNVEDDAGDQIVEDDAGDQNVEQGEGDQNIEQGEGDQAVGGPGDDIVQNINADDLVQIFTQLEFINQEELNAAINNENISNSTIVNLVLNGDLTIDQSSRFVDNSVTFDNDTTITTIIVNETNINRTVIENNITNIIDSNIEQGPGNQTVEEGEGDQETGPGDQIEDGNETDDGNVTPPGDNVTPPGDNVTAAPNITVTKNASQDEVLVSFNDTAGLLTANEPVTFTVTVTNVGNETATNVLVEDEDVVADLDEVTNATVFLVINSSTTQGEFSAITGEFQIDTLEPGESAVLTFDAIVVSTNVEVLNETVANLSATNVAELVNVDPNEPSATDDPDDVGSATVTLVGLLNITDPIGDNVTLPESLQFLNDSQTQDLLNSTTPDEVQALADAVESGAISQSELTEALANNTLTDLLGGLIDGTPGVAQVSAAGSSSFSLSGMAVGSMAVIGLLGSVLLIRRKDE